MSNKIFFSSTLQILNNVLLLPPSQHVAYCCFCLLTLVMNAFMFGGQLSSLEDFSKSLYDFVWITNLSTWGRLHRRYFTNYLNYRRDILFQVSFLGGNSMVMNIYFDFLAVFIVFPSFLINFYFSLENYSTIFVRFIAVVFVMYGQHYLSLSIFFAYKIFVMTNRCFKLTILVLFKIFKYFVFGIIPQNDENDRVRIIIDE